MALARAITKPSTMQTILAIVIKISIHIKSLSSWLDRLFSRCRRLFDYKHFFLDIREEGVSEGLLECLSKAHEDLPFRKCVPVRSEGLMNGLFYTLDVDERSVLLRVCRGGQGHVGFLCKLASM